MVVVDLSLVDRSYARYKVQEKESVCVRFAHLSRKHLESGADGGSAEGALLQLLRAPRTQREVATGAEHSVSVHRRAHRAEVLLLLLRALLLLPLSISLLLPLLLALQGCCCARVGVGVGVRGGGGGPRSRRCPWPCH